MFVRSKRSDTMSETDVRKVGLGVVLLVVSTGLLFGPANLVPALPAVLLVVATMGLAAGAFLVGTADTGRPV